VSKYFKISSVLLFTAISAQAGQWDLNDVTYLFPLPTAVTASGAIRAADKAPNGKVLIPIDQVIAVSKIPANNGMPEQTFQFQSLRTGDILPRSKNFDTYKDLFLIAIRIDPCFRDTFSDSCRKQVRAVWQPVDHWRENKPESVDAALHTFYDLSDNEFSTLLNDLQTLKRTLKVDTAKLPLGIHPGFSNTKVTEFQKAFRALILPFLGSNRIVRLARVTLEVSSSGWDLSSKDFLANGKKQTVMIFPGDVARQQTFNIAGIDSMTDNGMPRNQDAEGFKKVADEILTRKIYEPEGRAFKGLLIADVANNGTSKERGDQLGNVFRDSSKALALPEQRRTIFQRAARIENPAKHLPGTIDCVSCHIATSVKTMTGSPQDIIRAVPRFAGRYDLQNTSTYYGDSHNMRMLGYMYENIQLADRVIYESAEVADALNRRQQKH